MRDCCKSIKISGLLWLLALAFPACVQAQVRQQADGVPRSANCVGNGYFRLALSEGQPVTVEFDRNGKGKYGPGKGWLSPFRPLAAGVASVEGLKIRVQGAGYLDLKAGTGGYSGPFDSGDGIPVHGSLGQSFALPADGGRLTEV